VKKEIISTKQAPGAVGPYSQGVKIGEFVYTAGQIALNPATGEMVEGGITEQTRRVMHNLSAILEAAGTSLDQVIKTTVFLQDMGQFGDMNNEYGQHFSGRPPARSTVEVAKLPLDALVEIEVIAVVP